MLIGKQIEILLKIFTLYNILLFSLIIISLLLVVMILLQRNSDGFSDAKNIFGPNVRIDSQVNVTYVLIILFCAHILALNVIINKEFKNKTLTATKGATEIIMKKKNLKEKEINN